MRDFSILNTSPSSRRSSLLCFAIPLTLLLVHNDAFARTQAFDQPAEMSTGATQGLSPQFAAANCMDPNGMNCGTDTLTMPLVQSPPRIPSPQGEYVDAATGKQAAPNAPANAEPQPELTEFQRFVLSSTGIVLPRYGAELFRTRADRFASDGQAAAPETLLLGTDDELRIHTWGQINITADVHVDREGEIFLPKIGPIHVAGLSFADAKQQIKAAISRVYRNFECSIDLGEIHTIQIYLTGHAAHPGEYSVNALTTLLDAAFLGGGPSPAGSLRHLQLMRGGKLVADFDFYALLNQGDKSGDAILRNGDVVFIPPSGAEVALTGSIKIQAIFELRNGESISDLLSMAGGTTALAQKAQLSLERVDASGIRQAFQVRLDQQGLLTTLANGDILRLDAISSNYSSTVTLRGAVASPGHYRWHKGMRLSDLMPEREALESRDYWWHRTQLGLPAPEFLDTIEPLHPQGASQSTLKMMDGRNSSDAHAVQRPKAETNWNYAVIERLDRATMRTSLIPFDPGRLVLRHDPSQDLELEPGDVVTFFTQDDIALPVLQETRYVRLEGEFAHAGIYSVAPGESLRSLVQRAGGLTPAAYLYGAEFTRRSTRNIEQQRLDDYTSRLEQEMHLNTMHALSQPGSQGVDAAQMNQELLARLRQFKATGRIVLNLRPRSTGVEALPDMQLEDGDALLIPARPSTVQVMGAVMNPNAFLYRTHYRASDYLREAGGPGREADKSHMFILHADGSVTPKSSAQSIFASNSFSGRLNPGDTIVVPEKLWKPSIFAQIMPWMDVFSNFTLGAAALNAIK